MLFEDYSEVSPLPIVDHHGSGQICGKKHVDE